MSPASRVARTTPLPPTTVADAVWPAIVDARRATMMALLNRLAGSQWWPAARIRAHQFRQIGLLLDHARATVPFYRERLPAAPRGAAALDDDHWARVPLLKRAELQRAGDALRSTATPAAHGPTKVVTTSGSTGMAVRVLSTGLTGLYWHAFNLRDHIWQGRDLSLTLAAIRFDRSKRAVAPHGLRLDHWGATHRWGFPTGPSALLSIETPVDRQAEWLARQDAGFLITYPSNLEALARHCAERGIRLPALRHVQTVSEAVGPAVREMARAAWGLPVRDVYSAQEVGYLALQAPGQEHYLVQAENVLLEVLDDADRPCLPGQVGRVVVTALHNFATPLIRYDIGDYAEVGPPSPCGRGLPVLSRILGRTRSMVTLPTGERFWPFLRLAEFLAAAPVRQFQVVQKSLQRIELRLAVERPATAAEETRLRDVVQASVHHPFKVDIVYMPEIPRSPGGKYEDFRSEVAV